MLLVVPIVYEMQLLHLMNMGMQNPSAVLCCDMLDVLRADVMHDMLPNSIDLERDIIVLSIRLTYVAVMNKCFRNTPCLH